MNFLERLKLISDRQFKLNFDEEVYFKSIYGLIVKGDSKYKTRQKPAYLDMMVQKLISLYLHKK